MRGDGYRAGLVDGFCGLLQLIDLGVEIAQLFGDHRANRQEFLQFGLCRCLLRFNVKPDLGQQFLGCTLGVAHDVGGVLTGLLAKQCQSGVQLAGLLFKVGAHRDNRIMFLLRVGNDLGGVVMGAGADSIGFGRGRREDRGQLITEVGDIAGDCPGQFGVLRRGGGQLVPRLVDLIAERGNPRLATADQCVQLESSLSWASVWR